MFILILYLSVGFGYEIDTLFDLLKLKNNATVRQWTNYVLGVILWPVSVYYRIKK